MNASRSQLQWLDRPEGRIAYELEGDGPLVVCVPGMGELRSVFRFTVPVLVEAGLRVAVMDLRGHGDSDTTFAAYDDEAAASDAAALVAHLGAPAVLIGSSMGAAAAVIAAAEHPELVAGLALVGPFVRNPPGSALMGLLFRAAMTRPWARRVWAAYYPKYYPTRRPADFDAHLADIAASMRRPGYARAFAATTHSSHATAEAALHRVAAPVLVAMGDADPDFRDATAEASWIAERLNAELLMVPGGGHYPHVDTADVVGPRLAKFARHVTGG